MQGPTGDASPAHLNIFHCLLRYRVNSRTHTWGCKHCSRSFVEKQYVTIFPFASTGSTPTNSSTISTTSHADTAVGGLDSNQLQIAVQQYFIKGLAWSTHKTYHAGQNRYLQFCQKFGVTPVPTSERTLLMFTAHLAKEGIAHISIKTYLAAIRHLHVSVGMHHSYTQQLSLYLELVIRGIKKDQLQAKSPLQHLPITVDIMAGMYKILARTPNEPHGIMIWAACCTAFFGFLHCSEFTVPTQQEFDPEVHLTVRDIAVDDKVTPSVVCITIKQSKIDPFRQGINIFPRYN